MGEQEGLVGLEVPTEILFITNVTTHMVLMDVMDLLDHMDIVEYRVPVDNQVLMAILLLMEAFCGLSAQKMEALPTSLALDMILLSTTFKSLLK